MNKPKKVVRNKFMSIRIDDETLDQLRKLAAINMRTLTAQAVCYIREGVAKDAKVK
jgi:predicted transcriptional regulator